VLLHLKSRAKDLEAHAKAVNEVLLIAADAWSRRWVASPPYNVDNGWWLLKTKQKYAPCCICGQSPPPRYLNPWPHSISKNNTEPFSKCIWRTWFALLRSKSTTKDKEAHTKAANEVLLVAVNTWSCRWMAGVTSIATKIWWEISDENKCKMSWRLRRLTSFAFVTSIARVAYKVLPAVTDAWSPGGG